MRMGQLTAVMAAMTSMALGSPAMAQAAKPPAKPPVSTTSQAATGISPEADHALKQMSDYLGAAGAFTFHADVLFDHVLPSGQKIQFSANEDVALKRPGQLYVEWTGDLGNRQFWFDAGAVTLFDPSKPFYASAPAPGDIDAMLNGIQAIAQFTPPLADFLYRDPYGTVKDKVVYAVDLGPRNVGGKTCRSLAFVEKDIDFQIWIDAGDKPLPCKLLITYKNKPGAPQFSAVFSDWNFAPQFEATAFTPEIPATAKKIPFATEAGAK
jgi:hypothetical protein